MDKRIIKRTEVDPERRPGWVVDLSPAGAINPDCYWYFRTRKAAQAFLHLVDGGVRAEEAAHQVSDTASGTAPDTSLHLGEERREWLKAQGGIQPMIHKLIDREMGGG
jgi:hypothetical protein